MGSVLSCNDVYGWMTYSKVVYQHGINMGGGLIEQFLEKLGVDIPGISKYNNCGLQGILTKANGNRDFFNRECVCGTQFMVLRTYFGGQFAYLKESSKSVQLCLCGG